MKGGPGYAGESNIEGMAGLSNEIVVGLAIIGPPAWAAGRGIT